MMQEDAQKRLEAFEKMLSDILADAASEKQRMDKLKAEGREKSATYRQLMGNRLMYRTILSLYRRYALIDREE